MSDTDSDGLPAGITVPTTLIATSDEEGNPLSSGVTLIPFPFCIIAQGIPRQTVVVDAPSPALARLTIDQALAVANTQAAQQGFPPNLFSATAGPCP